MENSSQERDLKINYNIIADEVKSFVSVNETILASFPTYKGVQILFSELKHKPKFMLIGINPGPGYYNKYHENVLKYEEAEELEYFEETYRLGEETKHLFKLADCFDELYNAVKTNWTFLATPNANELDKLMGKLLYDHNINLYTKSDYWAKRMIQLVQPEIIICEGKKAFDRITWNVLGCHEDNEFTDVCYRTTDLCKHVIGYKRTPFGGIKNKEIVANKIREIALGMN